MHSDSSDRPDPVPQIDAGKCDGCGDCLRVCPTEASRIEDGVAVVAYPLCCEYHGLCEMVCPRQAVQRPFEILVECIDIDSREFRTWESDDWRQS